MPAEPCDSVGLQYPQGDAQPVVRGPERQGGEDVVDRVEAGLDLVERSTECACQPVPAISSAMLAPFAWRRRAMIAAILPVG